MRILRALAVLAICMGVASAQVTPVIPTGTVLGNSSGSAAAPSPLTTLPSGLLSAPGTIGGTTPSPATFTNLTASGTVSGSGFSSYLSTYLAAPAAIGGTTPAAATFSTLASTQAANLANGLTQAANTIAVGLSMIDSTAATSGNEQYSPATELCGNVYVSSTSEAVCWESYVLPSTAVTGDSYLLFGHNVNGGTFSFPVSVSSVGTIAGAGFETNFGSSASAIGNGLYTAGTNNPAIAADAIQVMSFLGTLTTATVPFTTGGTTFTVSGCGTASSVAGTGTTGVFTVGTGASTCTFTITINGATGMTAPHGWIANVDDQTAHIHCTNVTGGGSTTTAQVLCNSTVTTGDVISFHADPY
jgi:hypothetical protein